MFNANYSNEMSEYFSYSLTTQVTEEVRDALISRGYIVELRKTTPLI
jgi:hypothetical protein